jgi:MscS family membrane protein
MRFVPKTAASLLLLASGAFGQTSPASGPIDQRSTPKGTVIGFFEASRSGDYRRAASFLDLEHATRRVKDPAELAREFKAILDRKFTSDPGLLSNRREGDLTDGLDPAYELLGTVEAGGRKLDLTLERVTRDGNQIWLVSSSTVQLIPVLYAELGNTWAETHLPAWMLAPGPLDTAVWQWLALLILILVSFLIASLLARVVVGLLRPLLARTQTQFDDLVIDAVGSPLELLVTLALFRGGIVFVAPGVVLRTLLTRILTALFCAAAAWLAIRIIDVAATQFVHRMSHRQRASATSVVPLIRRSAKVAAIIIAVLATLSGWGYNTTALLAGLGVGGLAVALAAQKTIENLFGGVSITTDKPVLVGDFCRYGDKIGTVEDIGLRSTRVRTLDRTVVTIPNAEFSSLQIENFARRDKMFFHPTLNLRRDTTPEQIRTLISRFREILLNHPMVDPDPARVRFIGIGTYSLDIEIFSYMKTTDGDQFLIAQEELLLSIMEAVRDAGTALAVPSQLNVLVRDPITAARRAD